MNQSDDTAHPSNDNADDDALDGATPAGEAEAPPSPEAQLAQAKDQLLRALAEVENTRRRAQREIEDARKYSVANFARDVLNVADNLRRALDAVPEDAAASEDLKALVEGVSLTERELLNSMERHGIRKVDPKGEKFDHNLHQAMFETDMAGVEPGTVIEVAQAGYVIGDRLLRPAMVGVAKKPPASVAAPGGGDQLDTKA
ncbi:MAG: nucleotide exchange factor GrpE [Alphaproteobacteria bacterium]|nr:nucleotide exchange factor GrpE [Alphaproteobacteria bacterium]